VTAQQLEMSMETGRGWETLGELVPDPGTSDQLSEERFPHVHTDHLLDAAMRRMAASGLDVLPVVSRTNVRELKAVVSLKDILAAYGIGKTAAPAAVPAVPSAATPHPQTRLLGGVVAVMLALAMLIAFLNYNYRAQRAARADQYFNAGNQYMANARYEEAIGQYRDALSISHSLDHRMALADALTKAGNWYDAKIYWNEVLRESPSSGRANVGIARVLAAEGDTAGAVTHYERAIYGTWTEHPEQHRAAERMELIQTLNKAGRKTEAQAELLALIANSPKDPALREQIAQTCLQFGMFRQAAALFRELASQNDKDAAAFHGLGDAEFAEGDYQAARDAYRAAVKADPADTVAAQKTDLCQGILDLDPTKPGLSARQLLDRSHALLAQTVADVTTCPRTTDPLPEDVKRDLQEAQNALARTPRPLSWDQAGKTNLSAAERLWGDRSKLCAEAPADGPIAYVMGRLQKK